MKVNQGSAVTVTPLPQIEIPADLEKVKVQLNDALAERDELKEKYRDALRRSHAPESADKKEITRLRDELRALKATQQARIRAEREAERDQVQIEVKELKDSWQRMFTCLEKLAIKSVATLSEHEADSQEIRDLARELRNKPDELRSRLAMDELTYQDAFGELAPPLYAATAEIARFKKRGLPITKVEHRARMLLEMLDRVDEISTSRAIDIIYGDEGKVLCRKDVLRAMKKAATLEPHKATFSKGGKNGMPSELKRKGGSCN